MEKLNILLTNDDGFHAEGLQTLYNGLIDVANITIVAPDRERSAVGHGITMYKPLRAIPVDLGNHNSHWMVNGTPSDCVKLAIDHLLKSSSLDLIISGINRGPNLGSDILYSGTVSAAIEGTFYKIPSIAVSLANFSKANFGQAVLFIQKNLLQLKELAVKATLNINFPPTNNETSFYGVKFTKLGIRIYQNVFEERQDPRGQTYYWMSGEPVPFDQDQNSDIRAIEDGYISITPLNLDLTNYQAIEDIGAFSMKV